MGHNITVQQLLDRVVQICDTTSQYNNCWAEWYRYGTKHHSKTTDGQSGTDMGHNITVRQLLDRVVQICDTTSQEDNCWIEWYRYATQHHRKTTVG